MGRPPVGESRVTGTTRGTGRGDTTRPTRSTRSRAAGSGANPVNGSGRGGWAVDATRDRVGRSRKVFGSGKGSGPFVGRFG